jgi:hypothetical protein
MVSALFLPTHDHRVSPCPITDNDAEPPAACHATRASMTGSRACARALHVAAGARRKCPPMASAQQHLGRAGAPLFAATLVASRTHAVQPALIVAGPPSTCASTRSRPCCPLEHRRGFAPSRVVRARVPDARRGCAPASPCCVRLPHISCARVILRTRHLAAVRA